MRLVFIVFSAAVAIAQERNPHTSPADVAAGARIFRGHCAECHGLAGEGGRGPNLTKGVYYHGSTDADLFRNITDGIPGTAMPGVFFSADQVWQIVAHVRALAARADNRPPPGDATRGAQLFRSKQCLTCHQVRHEGGARGPDLTVIGSQRPLEHLRQALLDPGAKVIRDHWLANVTHENNTSYSGFVMNEDTYYIQLLDFNRGLVTLAKKDLRKSEILKTSAMPSYRGKLTDAETADLVAYMWSLRRAEIRSLP